MTDTRGEGLSVRYAFPDPRLFDFVAAIAQCRTGPAWVTDLIPPDMPSIRIIISGEWSSGSRAGALLPAPARSLLYGPSSRSEWISGQNGKGFALPLNPLFWPVLAGCKASDLADRGVPLELLWGNKAVLLEKQIVAAPDFETRVTAANDFLLSLDQRTINEGQRTQVGLMRAALADPGCATVAQLAGHVGLAPHNLSRLAKSCFGFPPKLLIQRERFRRMLHRSVSMNYENWHNFIESQYTDQSHLIRDFRRFLGMSPRQYFALDRPLVDVAFREVWRLLGQTPPVH